ncbi:BRCT domain [Dillenia turbinata]|uniref:BRCT domain n=1 Tax=Dillenia turbinata TaxID=194707 RepID=A0AAN8VI45_9MAGN
MADPSHLEKMGRELKCPICLSLLNSAVSLPCNHVFCNLCIQKSMKSASECPVCKVPYRRREIRPALHMDNLVNIYKNMEIASGINIFVTQSAPPTKLSDKRTEAKDDSGCDGLETDGKGSRKSFKNEKEDYALDPVKPSFPTKKRVQVPQPLPETLEQSRKFEDKSDEYVINNVSTVQSEKPTAQTLVKKEEVVFKPFFWLRDDDEEKEKSSQEADNDEVMETPVLDAPAFSDIKDSDDEDPSINTKDEMQNKSIDADIFDSEFFEWTQRPCSPELCSSPVKVQDANIREADEVRGKEYQAAPVGIRMEEQLKIDGTSSAKSSNETCIAEPELEWQRAASSRTENDNQEAMKRLNKRGQRMSGKAQNKAKKSRNLGANHCGSSEEVPNMIQEKTSHHRGNSLELEKSCTLSKSDSARFDESPRDRLKESNLLVEERDSGHPDKTPVENLSAQLGKGSTKTLKNIKEGRGSRTCPVRSKKQRLDSHTSCMLGGASEIQCWSNKDQTLCSSFPLVGQHGSSDTMKKRNKQTQGSQPLPDLKSDKESRRTKRLKGQRENTVENHLFSIEDGEAAVDRLETPVTPRLLNGQVLDDITPAQTKRVFSNKDGEILRKCETILKKVKCAFCHSAEDTEASGEMVHYLNGKPVAADFDGTPKVIHSHKNCTEWAPNVFFENDTPINLEAELARSRRIKCSLCGNKGAALGCYERSCRKSFHIPCAKSIPEFRWDTENFVMLCPLHPTSALPCESPGPQKKESSSNGQSPVPRSQVKVTHKLNPHWKGNPGSSDKMILCCSGLSPLEKETVAEFERISGVTDMKNWCSDITHVIASVDAKGACSRTLKVLMGIKACIKAMEPVDEEQYEIKLDIHGNRDGPRLGRLRILNKGPKLFDSLKFYFSGDFLPSYKKCLHDLIIAAGGTILHRKPISEDKEDHQSGSSKLGTLILYSLELADHSELNKKNMILKRRISDAEALAKATGSQIASNLWILNSIAACKLQNLRE